VISEETISQLGSDIEYDPERFDLRTDVFWQLSSIQWITGLVYSIIINACIIAVTTVGLVYHWPFSSDAMSGFVCGMMGLVAGIILGYVAAKVTFLVVVTKKLRAQCEELGVPI
jgi:fucose 4-O-acetylase-like acetyltransferase